MGRCFDRESNESGSTFDIIGDRATVSQVAKRIHACVEVRGKGLLKALSNEKRGGLGVVSFDRSIFKLISLKFSNKSVQAPSCERPKTTQRTLFLLFANNNCFQITLLCRRCMKKSGKLASQFKHRYWYTLPTLQISVGIIMLFEKIYYEILILIASSQI